MLRIYDDKQISRRTTLKRVQMVVLFAGGTACGLWLSGGEAVTGLMPEALAAQPVMEASAVSGCGAERNGIGLRLDCQLSVPTLPRAEGL